MQSQSSKTEFTAIIKVSDPQADPVKGFYTYLVGGSDHLGAFEIRRRYNDFFYLRESLVKKWPGLYVPPIPQKKIAGNKDVENIETRKKFFDFFLNRLANIQYLFKSSVTQEFLRNKNVDLEKHFSTLPNPKYSDLLSEYKNTFSSINYANQNTNQIKASISSFAGFLKKAEKQLEGIREQVGNIMEARESFTHHLNICNTSMLPEYEKNVYVEYLPEDEKKDLIFVNNQQVLNNVVALKDATAVNPFSYALDLITYEILEIRAMEQALKIKDKFEEDRRNKEEELLKCQSELAKLMGGKTTFKSLFSRGSKSEQIQNLQKQIPALQQEIKDLNEFNSILSVILGTQQLSAFKKQKQLQYYQMMFQVSQNELKYLATYGQLMKSVMQGLSK